MQYIGLDKQIRRNNTNSIVLLIAFPVLLLGMLFAFFFFINGKELSLAQTQLWQYSPYILAGVGIWFLIAWLGHASFIRMATGAKPLDRMENKRVYNLIENLCIAEGMAMPKVYVIHDDSLNAYASGIDKRSYAISLSQGIIDKLNDDELEGVMAHELTHIKNRDVRVLIVSIIFVGIFAFLAEMAFRSIHFTGRRSDKDEKGAGGIVLVAIVITAIAYFISLLLRFGISRKREYMADAGGAEMTKKPYALASALRKISNDPYIEAVESRDVAQLFINSPTPSVHKSASWDNMFASHPPIEKRIALLEQFV